MTLSLPGPTLAALPISCEVPVSAGPPEDGSTRQLPFPLMPSLPGAFQAVPGLIDQHTTGRYDATGQPAVVLTVTGSGLREGGRPRADGALIVPVPRREAERLGRRVLAIPAYGPRIPCTVGGHHGLASDRTAGVLGKNLRSWPEGRLGLWFRQTGGLPGDRIRLHRAADREYRGLVVWLLTLEPNRRWPWPRREQGLRL